MDLVERMGIQDKEKSGAGGRPLGVIVIESGQCNG